MYVCEFVYVCGYVYGYVYVCVCEGERFGQPPAKLKAKLVDLIKGC